MKLQTQVALSESQKAQIVARGEELTDEYTFDMSRKYAAVFSRLHGYTTSYSVSNDLIQINAIDELYAGESFSEKEYISDIFKSALASGTLKDTGSCDAIMQKILQILDMQKVAREEVKAKIERERPAREAKEAREAEEKRIAKEARDAKEAERESTENAEREAAKAGKLAWIEAHGSERLQKGIAAGYHCQKIYVGERGNTDLGSGYTLDYDSDIETKARSCPSLEALNEAERLTEAGIKAKVVWLPHGTELADEDDYCDSEPSGCEAVEATILGNWFYKTF